MTTLVAQVKRIKELEQSIHERDALLREFADTLDIPPKFIGAYWAEIMELVKRARDLIK